MGKLKTLYLNDLIELDEYKREYASLKKALEATEERPEINLDALKRSCKNTKPIPAMKKGILDALHQAD